MDMFKTVDELEIDGLIQSLGISGGMIRVMRRTPPANKWAYLCEYQVEGFTLEALKEYSGGGDYRLNVCNATGKTMHRIQISIDPRVKGKMDATPTIAGDNSGSLLGALLPTIIGTQKDSMAMLMAMMQQNSQSANESANRQMQMMLAMMTAGRDTGVKGDNTVELLKVFVPLLATRGGDGKPTTMKELMEQMKTMKDFIATPPAEPVESTMDKVLGILGPVAAGIMQARMQAPPPMARATVHPLPSPVTQQPQQAPQPAHVIPTSTVQPSNSVASPAPAVPTNGVELDPNGLTQLQAQVLAGVRGFLPFIVSGAKNDSDPAGYATMLADNADKEQIEALREVLRRPDWFGLLFGSNVVQADAFKDWFEELRELILGSQADHVEQASAIVNPIATVQTETHATTSPVQEIVTSASQVVGDAAAA